MRTHYIRCPRCERDLPRSEFHKNGAKTSGIQVYCKRCKWELNKASRARRRGHSTPSKKRCSKCRGVFTPADFYRDSAQKTGLTSWCRRCINTKNANLTAARHERDPLKNLPPDKKHCPKCKRVRDVEFFCVSRRSARGRVSWCRDCTSESQKRRREKEDPGWTKVIRRQAHLKYRLKQLGLTMEDYEDMILEQGNRCAICGSSPEDSRAKNPVLHIDHCHETGRVRGLLCRGCNHGLGSFGDDPRRVLLAARYLVKHKKAARCFA